MSRIIFLFYLSIVLFFFLPSKVFAHKIVIISWFKDDILCIEGSFDSGIKVNKGDVEIFNSSEQIILSGKTDQEGYFEFKIGEIDSFLKIVLSTQCGHKNFLIVSKDEIKNAKSLSLSNSDDTFDIFSKTEYPTLEQIEFILSKQLNNKLEPINRVLAANKQNKIELKDIFGGIGYIIGLIGLATYFKYSKIKRV